MSPATSDQLKEAATVLRLRAETEQTLRDGDPYYLPGGESSVWDRLMHPGVGLALADWLEHEIPQALHRERQRDEQERTRVRREPFPVYYDQSTTRALAVADAILAADVSPAPPAALPE